MRVNRAKRIVEVKRIHREVVFEECWMLKRETLVGKFLVLRTVEQEGEAEALNDTATQLEEQNCAILLERILHRDNLNEAFLRVKRNKGATGVDGGVRKRGIPTVLDRVIQ